MNEHLTATLKKDLLKYARAAIANKLQGESLPAFSFPEWMKQEVVATFVTLKKKGQLRGCIGQLAATMPLLRSVYENALHAAFDDYRFQPVSIEELHHITLEISLLTQPKNLPYRSSKELLKLLTPGVDGVILRHESARATFLPQVWKQLPQPEVFLGNLCHKAGLPVNFWLTHHPEIEIYQVEAFGEEELG